MPHIKKIELKNFKSFGPKTIKIGLDRGFSAITGPNGSGKTNIIDAVLFVLGELSSRRLRAQSAAKLIFHGSEKAGLERAKKAKVTMQFDNTDGRIPTDTSTVTISREVFRNGQSVYRLNGRRSSRMHILETLSIAGIGTTNQNIILQGTITRLTDISSFERRRIIEDLVGIGQYDAEKAEAEEKLREADISIRTAIGRIDEVQKRIDNLERERNELLRNNFIQKEIEKIETIKISHDMIQIKEKIAETTARADTLGIKVEKLRALRENFRKKRRGIEGEWRKLSSDVVEEGGSQVLKVQIRIGDVKSKLSELTTKISSGKISRDGLKQIEENTLQQYQAIRNEISENRRKTKHLKKEYEKGAAQLQTKEKEHNSLIHETAQMWENLGENSKKIREIEKQLTDKFRRLTEINSERLKNQTQNKSLTRRTKELKNRKEQFLQTINELEKSLYELEKVQKEQRIQLRSLEQIFEQRVIQKNATEREIVEAGKIADSARTAVIEFMTQKEIAETIAAEENALRSIEELGDLGVIQGVHGRFRNLVKIEKAYRRAIEVAAAGWLDAIIVKDYDTAFTCTGTLRKMKLGRIKIIPLEGRVNPKPTKIPQKKGINGAASTFIKCNKQYEQAVHFIFGDTIIVSDDKTAFTLSNQGRRAVTVNGDLYEAGGVFESGYYRAPIDFSTIIPSEGAINSLDEAVKALQQHLSRRNSDISSFEEEMERVRVEIVRLANSITAIDREIKRVKRNVKRTNANIKRLDRFTLRINKNIKNTKAASWTFKVEKRSIQKDMQKLQKELAVLKQKTSISDIQETEIERDRLAEEIITLRQKSGTIETKISTLQSQFDQVLEVGYKNAKIQRLKIKQQFRTLQKEITGAELERGALKQEVLELEKSRDELSKSLLSAKKDSQKFTKQIDDIDKELQKLDVNYEQSDRLLNQLQLKIQTTKLQREQYEQKLRQFGFTQPLTVTVNQVKEAEISLKMMQFELERIGAVNQLALSHYAEQISRYKELSLRMNELEKEKQAILQFMDEVEKKKRDIFVESVDKINLNLQTYFSNLTGGGNANLKLENINEPFAGGIDMIVQFPNKPSIIVSGASGGERSVAAVAFIFALKELTPTSFNILDEPDAHLDAVHVAKLADVLSEEAERNQFVVITLKPEMVNKAQKVYGVYELNGVSNVISTKFLEVANE